MRKKKKQKDGSKQVIAARQTTGIPAKLYGRREIVALTGLTYPTLWSMACRGEFPRGRIVGGKSAWLASEIEAWLAALQVRPLKGDA